MVLVIGAGTSVHHPSRDALAAATLRIVRGGTRMDVPITPTEAAA